MIEKPNRRKVLNKMAGFSGAAAVTTGSTEAASPRTERTEARAKRQRISEKYTDNEAVRGVVREHAVDITTELNNIGVVDTEDPGEVLAQSTIVNKDVINQDGTQTAFINFEQELEGGRLEVYVLPEVERSYAFVREDSGDKILVDSKLEGNSKRFSVSPPDIPKPCSGCGPPYVCTACGDLCDTFSEAFGCTSYYHKEIEVECENPCFEYENLAESCHIVDTNCPAGNKTSPCCSDEGTGCGFLNVGCTHNL